MKIKWDVTGMTPAQCLCAGALPSAPGPFPLSPFSEKKRLGECAREGKRASRARGQKRVSANQGFAQMCSSGEVNCP